MKGLRIGGEGRAVEIDGATFGGHVRPENRSGKRRVVVAMRERGGRILPQVFAGEDAAVPASRQRIARGTVVHADESPAWNPLHARFAMQRINHQHGFSVGGACTNGAAFSATSPTWSARRSPGHRTTCGLASAGDGDRLTCPALNRVKACALGAIVGWPRRRGAS